jgi:hypothetical protein
MPFYQLTTNKWVNGFQFIQGTHKYWHALCKFIDALLHGLANARLCSSCDSCRNDLDDWSELLSVVLYCNNRVAWMPKSDYHGKEV